jgi:hypothetical protein
MQRFSVSRRPRGRERGVGPATAVGLRKPAFGDADLLGVGPATADQNARSRETSEVSKTSEVWGEPAMRFN